MRRPRPVRRPRAVRRSPAVSPGPPTLLGVPCGRRGGGMAEGRPSARGRGTPPRRRRARWSSEGQREPPRGPHRRGPGRVTGHARRCGVRLRPVARVALLPRGRRRRRGHTASRMRQPHRGRRTGRMRQARKGRQACRGSRTLSGPGPRMCKGRRTRTGHRTPVAARVPSRTSSRRRPGDPTQLPEPHAPVTWPARRCVPRGFRRSGSELPPGTRESRAGGGAEGPGPALPRPVRPWRTAAPRHRSGSWPTGWATPST